MKKTILVIGDIVPQFKIHSSFRDFLNKERYLYRNGINLKVIEYYEVLDGHLPDIETQNITVMMFFPYHYWDENIEVKGKDSRIYGDETYGKKFNDLFQRIERRLKAKYKYKNINFINPPASVRLDRDKKKTKNALRRAGIPTPKEYHFKSYKDVFKILNKDKSIFIKPRFGAMGKGITLLTPKRWYTNYIFRKGKIISRDSDYGWKFFNVTGNKEFLRKLLSRGVICEEVIEHPVVDGKKFDFRVYVVFNEIPYIYAKSTFSKNVITNWSQGGTIESHAFLRKLPKASIETAKVLAKRTSKALKLNYTGVDVIFSKDFEQAYVLEAHSFPGYERGFDLMKFLVKKL